MDPNYSLGYWLRRQRLAHDLLQSELAKRIGIAPISLRKIEADERRPSPHVAERIAAALELDSVETRILLRVARAELSPAALALPRRARVVGESESSPTAPVATPLPLHRRQTHNLPAQPNALIGRETEIAAVQHLFQHQHARVVTLTGPGGSGKTRLALASAQALRSAFPDGVWLVELAPLHSPTLVLTTIAHTFDLRESAQLPIADVLHNYLRERRLLLLLDNVEHLLDACSEISQLVDEASGLSILTTSRIPLRFAHERVLDVPPLAAPAPSQPLDLSQVAAYPAVRLFVERAQAVLPHFALTAHNAANVAAICDRLDGLPLAVELAAARMRFFSPDTLLGHLDRRLHIMPGGPSNQPPRQQTLRSAIAWSYQLLSPVEQRLFCRLGVLVGGCTIAAAESVSRLDETPIILSSLAEQNMLRRIADANNEARYRMLETIREFALEKLAASGEQEAAHESHAAYFLDLVKLAEPELRGPRQAAWYQQLRLEHDNLRAALGWLAERGDAERFARLCAGLWRFWWSAGFWQEGRRWLERALECLPIAEKDEDGLRAQVLLGAGWLLVGASEFAAAEQCLLASSELVDRSTNMMHEAEVRLAMARAAYGQSDAVRAHDEMTAALKAYQAAGDQYNAVEAAEELGYLCYHLGDLIRAQRLGEEALNLARTVGNQRVEANALTQLGLLSQLRGEYALADEQLTQGLALQRRVGDTHAISSGLNYLGGLALQQDDLTAAETYLSEAVSLRRSLGDRRGASAILLRITDVALRRGDYSTAKAHCRQSLTLAHALGYLQGLADGLLSAATIESTAGWPLTAACLLGAADSLRAQHQLIIWPEGQPTYDQLVQSLRATLGEERFTAALDLGKTYTLDEALALAVEADK